MQIISILVFLLILTVIVSLHELGHFMSAKKFGVYCKEFAIGMGPKVWQKQKGETVYSIRLIPMGGYVQMIGEDGELFSIKKGDNVWLTFNDEGKISDIHYTEQAEGATQAAVVALQKANQPMELTYIEGGVEKKALTTPLVTCTDSSGNTLDLVANDRQFNYLPPLKKIVVLTAGVMMNFILALVVVFIATWLSGVVVDPIIATDTTTDVSNQFAANDRVLRINDYTINDAESLTNYVRSHKGESAAVLVNREGEEVVLHRTINEVEGARVTQNGEERFTYGVLGVTYARDHWNIGKIVQGAWHSFIGFFEYVYVVLLGLFTGKISFLNLTGFVGIAQQTNAVISNAAASSSGVSQIAHVLGSILSFTAFLSVNIGVMNILPIPALDGGRVVFALYELIFRRKPNPKFETYFNVAGFILLIGLFVGITILDIMRQVNP